MSTNLNVGGQNAFNSYSHMSSMLRNVVGNETEPTILVYQSKKGMKEIRNIVKK